MSRLIHTTPPPIWCGGVVVCAAGPVTLPLVRPPSEAVRVLYAPYTAGRFRLRLMSAVALGVVGSVALGVLTHDQLWLNIVAMALLAVVSSVVCVALKVGPPGAYFFVLVCGVAGYVAYHGQNPVLVVGMAAVGGAVQVLPTWQPTQ